MLNRYNVTEIYHKLGDASSGEELFMEPYTALQQQLFTMQDLKYRDFHSRLLPGIDKETIIGIRTPILRKFAKEFRKTEEAKAFLQELPHQYYEENNLHLMIVNAE